MVGVAKMFLDGILGRRSGPDALRPRLFSPMRRAYLQEEISEGDYYEEKAPANPRLNMLYSYIQPFIGKEYGFDVDDLNERLRKLPTEDQASIADLVLDGPRSEEFDAFRASLIPVRLGMIASYLKKGIPIEEYADALLRDYYSSNSPVMKKIRGEAREIMGVNRKYK